MADTIVKTFTGDYGSATATAGDAKEAVKPLKTLVLDGAGFGASAMEVLWWVPEADVTIKAFYIVPSEDIATGANKPELYIAKGDLAAVAVTEITVAATGRIDFTTDAQTAMTKSTTGVLLTTAAADIDAGKALYLMVGVNGTPAVLGAVHVTWVVEWEYRN